MVWPTSSIPTYGRGVWLECNGQSFSRTQFPQLYETLGTNRVPDYQGMFLRGYGNQSYSQDNGIQLPSSTIYSSGSIGNIQGDSLRDIPKGIIAPDHVGAWAGARGGTASSTLKSIENEELYWYSDHEISSGDELHHFVMPLDNYTSVEAFPIWTYKYTLNYSVSTDEDGNQVIDNIELVEDKEDVAGTTKGYTHYDSYFYFENNFPVSNEIRPVNVAVKFMIKAK